MRTTDLPSRAPFWPLIAFGVVALIVTLMKMGPVLAGDLPGSDDMMRMQQVRDLISGAQSWYDVSQDRLLTPDGGAMHWSRLPDMFLAGVVLVAQPLVGREMAEAIAVIAWPALQLIWAFAALAVILRRLAAPLSGQLAGLFFFCTSFAVMSYLPGRIDHHGLGLALSLTAFASLLSPQLTARSAVVAAVSVAAMMTVAIENLPVACLIIAAFGMAWIVRGAPETNRLRFFGAALVVAALIAYVFDAPGAGGLRAVCDAYGQSHFVAFLVAGAGMFAIATVMPETRDWKTRLIAMSIAGAVTAGSFVAINPDCLGDPYARLSGDVQSGWLSVVSEARSLPAVFGNSVPLALYYYGFALAGVICALVGLLYAPRGRRFAFGCLLALCSVSFLVAAWQLRGAMLAHAAAVIASGWAFGELFGDWWARRGTKRALALFGGALVISPIGWHLPQIMTPQAQASEQTDCRSAAVFRPIGAAPRMIVFTPIDLGSPLIYHTRHYASAAPYHRNPSSIEMTLSVFGGSAETARQKIVLTGATHLLYCAGLNELETYARRSPSGLAADLEAGRIPNWLIPLNTGEETGEGPIVYTIAFDRN